jgi:hypothetical protein
MRRSAKSYDRLDEVSNRFITLVSAAVWLAVLSACAREVLWFNVRDGSELIGMHHPWSHALTVMLPSGEVAQGPYQPLTLRQVGEDSLFYRTNLSELLGRNTPERFHGYARLAGDRGTIVEIVFSSDWTGRGFGVAKTSTGEEYRLSF